MDRVRLGREYVTVCRPVLALCVTLLLGFVAGAVSEESASSWAPPTADDALERLTLLPFDVFVDASFLLYLERFPEDATLFGLADGLNVRHDRLNDRSTAFLAETRAVEVAILDLLRQYDTANLSADQRIVYDAYVWMWEDKVAAHRFPYAPDLFWRVELPEHLESFMSKFHPLQTPDHVIDYLSRLQAIRSQFDQLIASLEEGLAFGVVPYRGQLVAARRALRNVMGGSAYDTIYYTSFRDRLGDVPSSEDERRAWRRQVAQTIEQEVIPAYRKLSVAFGRLLDEAPLEPGVYQYPDGEEFYAYCLEHFTQQQGSPETWHDIGRQETERGLAQLEAFAEEIGITGTPHDIVEVAAAASGMLEGEAILDRYRALVELARQRSEALLGLFPEADVEVLGHADSAMYFDAPDDGSRLATFYAPTHVPQAAYLMPMIAYHETYPGHHVQRMLAQEAEVPLFLQSLMPGGYQQGYVEGWATYTESLVAECGWYDEEVYAHIGQLYYALVRSVAVVVNTGLHAMAWTFDEALAYYVATLGISEEAAEGYVLAHLPFPGRYAGYRMGALAIQALRETCEQALVDAFSLPTFHDAVLRFGALPLNVLESAVYALLMDGS